ncbi:MAG: rRNA pseudouridine synthase [Burkholderiales bacterium]|jgi:23S rRNA pseudouridine2604 synthase|nr:rRNA pseudouridine synthase [Burkholderiales bacterium]
MEPVRLNKYLKDQDICSRRKADEFIAKGYVKVNGQIVTELGLKVDPQKDKVEILPELLQEKSEFKYIILNKPIGYVCSKSVNEGLNIFSLLPNIKGLTYAGRLDKDSRGLLLLSNDGKFVYKALGNEFKCEKEYIVRVNKPITENFLNSISNGSITLDDKRIRPCRVSQVNEYVFGIILTEGINRQIRRMAEHQGYTVLDLERVRIGNIRDRTLSKGQWRYLTKTEILSIE